MFDAWFGERSPRRANLPETLWAALLATAVLAQKGTCVILVQQLGLWLYLPAMNNSQHPSKLQKPPLQEVVFEARWKPDVSKQSRPSYDTGFELAQGRLSERLERHGFHFHRRIVPDQVPTSFLTDQIVHQFWHAQDEFPLVQFGPCIITVNEDGKGYEWERSFCPLIRQTLDQLMESYKNTPTLAEVNLLYIDAIDLPDAADFLHHLQKLRVNLQFGIHDQQELADVKVDFGYQLDHDSTLRCSIQSATNNRTGNPALMWHTAVHRNQCESWEGTPHVVDSVMEWCQYAHATASNLFKNMTQGELYESFL